VGHSFTDYQGKGFWSNDGWLELWLELLARRARLVVEPSAWLTRAAEEWHLHATAGWNRGWVSAQLDEFAATPEQAELVLGLAAEALRWLEDQGDLIPADLMHDWNLGGPNVTWTADLPTERFARVGREFVRLLRGEIETGPADAPCY